MMKKCLYLFLILSVMFSGLTIQAYGLEDITIKKSQLGEEISISGDALPDTWVN